MKTSLGQSISSLSTNLKDRADALLAELDALRAHLRRTRRETSVEIAHFQGTVRSELNMLRRLTQQEVDQASVHIARSSNLPFLETVWNSAKQRRNLMALQKRFFFSTPDHVHGDKISTVMNSPERTTDCPVRKTSCNVDVVTEGGRHWIKVSLITNSRLLFDLAKQGWESSEGSEDGDEDKIKSSRSTLSDDFDVPLVQTVKELATASASVRIRTRHPKVTMVLPRVVENETDEVDRIIAKCRATGVSVVCGSSVESPPSIEDVLDDVAPSSFATFSDVLNVDCTILLALVSDFSHAKVPTEPWFHKALERQVEVEDNENLLPALLYPIMGSHRLVCTREAADRMREIVETIGTPSEKSRTLLLMESEGVKTQEQLVQEMQSLSAHKVPSNWQLPIGIVKKDDSSKLIPLEAHDILNQMTIINKSVFSHGWASGQTTITSNRAIVRQIESGLDKHCDLEDTIWPRIWLCPIARSLVGKEKRGAKKSEGRE